LDSLQKPDFIAKDLQSISESLTEIISISK